jgi:aryl-alcohol dehydrogenase-like predicted oxidoreductase
MNQLAKKISLQNLKKSSRIVEGFHNVDQVKKMMFRELLPGMNVSALSLGGSSFGGVYDENIDVEECAEILSNAVRKGINLIDTAPWYGQGRSEKIIGHALSKIPRDAYYIFTKVGRYDLDVEGMFDFRAERVERSVNESMERLGLDYLDCVQVHDPEFAPCLDVIVNETVPQLQQLKNDGKIGMIGMTGYDLEIQRDIIERCSDEKGIQIDTSLTYCHYSMNDNTLIKKMKNQNESFLEFASRNKIGLINASPLSMGLLTNRGPPSWHPATQEIRDACRDAASYCESKSIDIAKLAMYFTLSYEDIATTLVSFATREIADQSIQYVVGCLRFL